MADYQYLSELNRYRNLSTGRFVSRQAIQGFSQLSIETTKAGLQSLSQQVGAGNISSAVVKAQMRQEIKSEYIRQYLLGRGGRNAMTQRDWGIVGSQLKKQYGYLDNFMGQVSDGRYTDAAGAFEVRSGMYLDSAQQAFYKANSEARGMPGLPQMPGDGKTICLTNCQCNLEFDKIPSGYNIWWRLNIAAKHCSSCISMAQAWSPLQFRDGSFSDPFTTGFDETARQRIELMMADSLLLGTYPKALELQRITDEMMKGLAHA